MKLLNIFLAIGLLGVDAGVKAENAETAKPADIVVYRSPSCGCCGKWLEHLKKNNFNVKDIVSTEVQAIKDKYGVPGEMTSCHTALIDGYVVEGHVPANDINALLKAKPKVVGIAVPGMPAGTPGMEMGGRKDPYQVVSFDSEKHYQVFNSYESK